MVRLIDADALLKTHCNECTLYPNDCLGDGCDNGAVIHIKEAPTVDAVPVIRCKDCKNAKCIHEDDDWWECSEGHRVMHGEGFCSWAERKEE